MTQSRRARQQPPVPAEPSDRDGGSSFDSDAFIFDDSDGKNINKKKRMIRKLYQQGEVRFSTKCALCILSFFFFDQDSGVDCVSMYQR